MGSFDSQPKSGRDIFALRFWTSSMASRRRGPWLRPARTQSVRRAHAPLASSLGPLTGSRSARLLSDSDSAPPLQRPVRMLKPTYKLFARPLCEIKSQRISMLVLSCCLFEEAGPYPLFLRNLRWRLGARGYPPPTSSRCDRAHIRWWVTNPPGLKKEKQSYCPACLYLSL